MNLFVDGRKIVDENGKEYSIVEARQAWEAHEVADSNLAFTRLASHFDFDFEALENFYREDDARRAARVTFGGQIR